MIPFKATELAKELELSSTFQPEIFTATVPVLVSSNQSAPTGLFPLDHGATSETIRVTPAGVSITTSVTDKVKFNVASGVLPTLASSTLMVTV